MHQLGLGINLHDATLYEIGKLVTVQMRSPEGRKQFYSMYVDMLLSVEYETNGLMLSKSLINHSLAGLSVSLSHSFGLGGVMGFTMPVWITNTIVFCSTLTLLVNKSSFPWPNIHLRSEEISSLGVWWTKMEWNMDYRLYQRRLWYAFPERSAIHTWWWCKRARRCSAAPEKLRRVISNVMSSFDVRFNTTWYYGFMIVAYYKVRRSPLQRLWEPAQLQWLLR